MKRQYLLHNWTEQWYRKNFQGAELNEQWQSSEENVYRTPWGIVHVHAALPHAPFHDINVNLIARAGTRLIGTQGNLCLVVPRCRLELLFLPSTMFYNFLSGTRIKQKYPARAPTVL